MNRVELLASDSARTLTWVVVPVVVALALNAWRRSHYRGGIALLELLRLAIVGLILFALHQPERLELEPDPELPKVLVVWDDSESMQTRDVLTPGAVDAQPVTRAEWLAGHLDLEGLRARLAGRFEVLAEPLSKLRPDPALEADAADTDEAVAVAPPTGTDLAGPLRRALELPGLRALVLLGDGDWNEGGDPVEAAMRYRMQGVPILARTVGSRQALPDVEFLPLEPPAFALVGKPLSVPFALRSSMDRDLRVPVTLTDSDGQVVREEVLLPARSTYEGSLVLTPRSVGSLTLRAEVPPQTGELDATNNAAEVELDVREESLRVLLVESYPRWEYRYLRNAMVRDPGVEVDCYLLHPDIEAVGGGPHYLDAFPERQQLSQYDVVFLGDVGCAPGQLTEEQCRMLRGLVTEQASGLILMPGLRGNQATLADTELGGLVPVDMDPAAPRGHGSRTRGAFVLTEAGRRSTLTQLAPDEASNARLWSDLPGFQWHAGVLRARPGSTVLAVHSSRDDGHGRVPLLVTRHHGTGKVLFMGTDAAWRWREGVEDLHHYRFWRQVVRWMAYQRKMNAGDTMRLFHTPDRPGVRKLTTLFANVMDASGAPLEDATVEARIESPSGRVTHVRFDADEGEWGLYRAAYRALEPGTHAVRLTCRDTQDELLAELDVVGSAIERKGLPARHDVMAELARVSRGSSIQGADLSRVEEHLLGLETPPEVARRTRLWSHPALGGLLVLLMAAFWSGRKLVGRF